MHITWSKTEPFIGWNTALTAWMMSWLGMTASSLSAQSTRVPPSLLRRFVSERRIINVSTQILASRQLAFALDIRYRQYSCAQLPWHRT